MHVVSLALCAQGQLTGGCLGPAGPRPGALVRGQHHHPLAANLQLDDLAVLEALGLAHLRGGEGLGLKGNGVEACG